MSKPTLSFEEVCKRLNKPPLFVEGIGRAGLLGEISEGRFTLNGIDNFERFGTQWNTSLDREPFDGLESHETGYTQTPLTYHWAEFGTPATLDPEKDIGWIAQYYFRPNRAYYLPNSAICQVGPTGVLLPTMRHILVEDCNALLCPDPTGNLAMIMLLPKDDNVAKPEAAHEVSDEIFRSIRSILAFEHDRPLVCCQSFFVGLPSGVIRYSYFRSAKAAELRISAFEGHHRRDIIEIKALVAEALSNADVFYKFLCLWKALELTALMKKEFNNVPEERLPTGFEFVPHEGKKFSIVVDLFRVTHRNAIAHTFLSGQKVRKMTSRKDVDEVWFALPIFFYMVKFRISAFEASVRQNG